MNSGQIPNPHCDYGGAFTPLIAKLVDIPGDVAEFGVYRGGTARQLATMTGRTVYAFDTFTGIPKEDFDKTTDHDEPGKFAPGYSVEELFRDCPSIIPIQGRFANTLPTISPSIKLAFVYIDCDLYMSAKQVLDWIPEHLSPGAIVFFDDYDSHCGIRKAVDEFVAIHLDTVQSDHGPGSSFYFIWNKDN